MNRRRRVAAFTLLILVGGCVSTSETALSSQDLTVTVRVHSAKLDFTTTFVHRVDDIHKCVTPARIRSATAAPGYVAGYGVVFGPDAARPEDGGSTVPMGTVVPGRPPLDNPVVKYFSLTIDPLPNQLTTTGPVKVSRSFSIGMAIRGAWKGRFDEADPKTSGSVTLDRDGLGGRFRLANVEPDLAHGRVAESEYVTVTGSWRCPGK